MPQYLSDEWFAEMADAAAQHVVEADGQVALKEVITDSPYGTVTYVVHISEGKISFARDEDAADVTFTQGYDTAVSLHKGELTIHDAFFGGSVRVAGHLNTLLDHSDVLQGLGPAFESVRSSTTY